MPKYKKDSVKIFCGKNIIIAEELSGEVRTIHNVILFTKELKRGDKIKVKLDKDGWAYFDGKIHSANHTCFELTFESNLDLKRLLIDFHKVIQTSGGAFHTKVDFVSNSNVLVIDTNSKEDAKTIRKLLESSSIVNATEY